MLNFLFSFFFLFKSYYTFIWFCLYTSLSFQIWKRVYAVGYVWSVNIIKKRTSTMHHISKTELLMSHTNIDHKISFTLQQLNVYSDNILTVDSGRARQRKWCAYRLQPLWIAGPVEKLFRLIYGLGENTVKNPSKVLLIQGTHIHMLMYLYITLCLWLCLIKHITNIVFI